MRCDVLRGQYRLTQAASCPTSPILHATSLKEERDALKVKEDEERKRNDVWKWMSSSWHVIFQADAQEQCSESCWGKTGLPTQNHHLLYAWKPFELLTCEVWLFKTEGPAAWMTLIMSLLRQGQYDPKICTFQKLNTRLSCSSTF